MYSYKKSNTISEPSPAQSEGFNVISQFLQKLIFFFLWRLPFQLRNIVHDVQIKSILNITIHHLDLVQKVIKNESHIIQQLLLARLFPIILIHQQVYSHSYLRQLLRIKIKNLKLLWNEIFIVLLNYLYRVKIDDSTSYYLFLGLPDLELLVQQVPQYTLTYIRVKLNALVKETKPIGGDLELWLPRFGAGGTGTLAFPGF